jgi:hypothetical protein
VRQGGDAEGGHDVKRWDLRISVFLLLGAIINVAVAWWIIWNASVDPVARIELPSPEDRRLWQSWRPNDAGDSAAFTSRSCSRCLRITQISGVRKPNSYSIEFSDGRATRKGGGYWPSTVFGDVVRVDASGWPAISLQGIRCETRVQPGRQPNGDEITRYDGRYFLDDHWIGRQPVTSQSRFRFGIPIQRSTGNATTYFTLPLLPIWPGFAINTVFYAGILWLLFAVPYALRRRRRIKRGLCPACAYPVGENDVCTECGRTLKVRGAC